MLQMTMSDESRRNRIWRKQIDSIDVIDLKTNNNLIDVIDLKTNNNSIDVIDLKTNNNSKNVNNWICEINLENKIVL